MTTKEIQLSVQRWLYDCNHQYQACNYGKTGYYEADVLGVTLSYMVTEVEVKISISDFKADFKKISKHLRLSNPKLTAAHISMPNRFYYACPKGLIPLDKIPSYAGLLYVDEMGQVECLKSAPLLHRLKASDKLIIGMLQNLTCKTIFGMQKMTFDNMEAKRKFEERKALRYG